MFTNNQVLASQVIRMIFFWVVGKLADRQFFVCFSLVSCAYVFREVSLCAHTKFQLPRSSGWYFCGWMVCWPAKPEINANLSPAWLAGAWAELGKNEKCSICHETNSVWYGSSDSCKMAPPESFEVQYSLLSKILAEKGLPLRRLSKTPNKKSQKKNRYVQIALDS